MAAFIPDPNLLGQVFAMLEGALSTDNNLQRQAASSLDQYSSNPQFLLYLAHIFSGATPSKPEIQQIAGLTLKTSLDRPLRMQDASGALKSAYLFVEQLDSVGQDAIKSAALAGLASPISALSSVAANIISTIIRIASLSSWVELPSLLCSALDAAVTSPNNIPVALASLRTLKQVIEDDPSGFVESSGDQVLAGNIIPRLLHWMTSSRADFRLQAAKTMCTLYTEAPLSVRPYLKDYLFCLSNLTMDTSTELRAVVCASLEQIVGQTFSAVLDIFVPIVSFAAASLRDPDEDLASAAVDLLTQIVDSLYDSREDAELAQNPQYRAAEASFANEMPTLVRLLLDALVFSPTELADLTKVEQARPHIYKGSGSGRGGARALDAESGTPSATPHSRDEDDDEDDADDDGDDDDLHGEVVTFSLRKRSAACVDFLAMAFPELLLKHLLPELEARLGYTGQQPIAFTRPSCQEVPAWAIQESGVLTVGAISDGCTEHISSILPSIFGYILNLAAASTFPALQASVCWTLSRYAEWVLERDAEDAEKHAETGVLPASAGVPYPLRTLISSLATLANGGSPRVQKAAFQALGNVAMLAEDRFSVGANETFVVFVQFFQRGAHPLGVLLAAYDCLRLCIEHIALDSVPNLAEGLHIICQSLFHRFKQVPDADNELVPLAECIVDCSPYLTPHIDAEFPYLLSRAQQFIDHDLSMFHAASLKGEKSPSLDLLPVALDLVNAVAEIAGPAFQQFLATESGSSIVPVAIECIKTGSYDASSSAFALLGEISSFPVVIHYIRSAITTLLPIVIALIGKPLKTYLSTANNATWFLGLILQHLTPEEITPYLEQIGIALCRAIIFSGASASFYSNVACTMGRLSFKYPSVIANAVEKTKITTLKQGQFTPSFSSVLERWIKASAICEVEEEKFDSVLGIFSAVNANPQQSLNQLKNLGVLIASMKKSWREPLLSLSRNVMLNFKAGAPAAVWGHLWSSWNHQTQQSLMLLAPGIERAG